MQLSTAIVEERMDYIDSFFSKLAGGEVALGPHRGIDG